MKSRIGFYIWLNILSSVLGFGFEVLIFSLSISDSLSLDNSFESYSISNLFINCNFKSCTLYSKSSSICSNI